MARKGSSLAGLFPAAVCVYKAACQIEVTPSMDTDRASAVRRNWRYRLQGIVAIPSLFSTVRNFATSEANASMIWMRANALADELQAQSTAIVPYQPPPPVAAAA